MDSVYTIVLHLTIGFWQQQLIINMDPIGWYELTLFLVLKLLCYKVKVVLIFEQLNSYIPYDVVA